MNIRRAPLREAPPLPVDWRPARRDYGPPRLGAVGRAAVFVTVALMASYLAGWVVS